MSSLIRSYIFLLGQKYKLIKYMEMEMEMGIGALITMTWKPNYDDREA